MTRRPAGLILALALLLIAGACSSETVIAEGRLAAPTESPARPTPDAAVSTDDRGERDIEDQEPEPIEIPDFQLVDPSQVAGLLADCEAGSDMACDVLYAASDFGSEEEQLGLACAGRESADRLFCTPGLQAKENELVFDESSPALPGLVQACEDGDMTACDLLIFRSPVASIYEEIGRSCGGRTAVVLADCRTAFPEA